MTNSFQKTTPRTLQKTICRMCHGGCGAVVHLENGVITRLSGEKTNPNNTGFLCAKGLAAPELVYHPDRLRHPMLRVGRRGAGKYERIGWNEAYSILASKIEKYRRESGAESIVCCQGTDRNYQEWFFRFANGLGTPNVLGPAHVCFYPRVMASIFSMGAFTFCDYEGTPACLVVWGSNKIVTHGDGVIGVRLLKALKRGSALVVIDPRRTTLASKARYWLQIRPGTDTALALGLIHVILASSRYDKTFVEGYCSGFGKLSDHVHEYAPDKVSQITGIPASLIEEVALFYADAPRAAIEVGTGIEQNRNSFHSIRAINILRAICGNLDRPGGDVIWEPTGLIGRRTFPAKELLPPGQERKRLGSKEHRILAMAGWAHPGSVWKAILEKQPYPVKMLFVLGSNPLVTYADSDRVFRALEKVDFLVVGDLFLTPTAAMADLVLPITSWLERDQIVEHGHYVAARKKIVQLGECKSDEDILNTLAGMLGLEDVHWPSLEDALNFRLHPLRRNWKDLVAEYYLSNQLVYYKYRENGFKTRDGKFNIYHEGLARMGYEPLPVYRPVSKEKRGEGQFILTSCHSPYYFNSEFRNLPALRKKEPNPTLEIHRRAARRLGICEGDPVWVQVGRKSALFHARLSEDVTEEVVYVSACWWYPELSFGESWRRSNVNRLTQETDTNEEMGSSNFRGILCRIQPLKRTTGPRLSGPNP